jgi:hypothetical protein
LTQGDHLIGYLQHTDVYVLQVVALNEIEEDGVLDLEDNVQAPANQPVAEVI